MCASCEAEWHKVESKIDQVETTQGQILRKLEQIDRRLFIGNGSEPLATQVRLNEAKIGAINEADLRHSKRLWALVMAIVGIGSAVATSLITTGIFG